MIGRITRVLSNDYTVRYDDGNEDICKARGVFRNKKISLAHYILAMIMEIADESNVTIAITLVKSIS